MALFLGASLVTFLEVADLVARSGCRACTRSLRNRKRTRRKSSSAGAATAMTTTSGGGADTNHVLFRSVVDVNDDEVETTTSADGGISANHRNHQVNRGLQPTSTRASSLRRTPTSPSSTSSTACVPVGHQGSGGSGTAGNSPATAASVGGSTGLVGLTTTLSRTMNDNGGHVRPTASNALVAALLSETDI